VAGWVLPAEFWGPDARAVVGSLFHCFFAIGIMTVALFAFVVRPWRWLMVVVSIPCAPFVVFLWLTKYLIPESPRWLVLRGREDDAKDILLHAGRVSNRPLPPSMTLFVPDVLKRKGHIKDLFGWSWIRYQTLSTIRLNHQHPFPSAHTSRIYMIEEFLMAIG
jgi:MFS transporter, OCT family, solute carrier family 22 (organic cation transporter), member 4/5